MVLKDGKKETFNTEGLITLSRLFREEEAILSLSGQAIIIADN